jgi:hypothetical protein
VIQKGLPKTTTNEERKEVDVKALKNMFESDNTLRALTLKGQASKYQDDKR